MDRRTLLKQAVRAAALATLPRAATLLAADGLRTQALGDSAYAVLGPDANVLVVATTEGPVLVDGGHADWAAALLELVAERGEGRPVRALVNTHWHPQQTGANVALGNAGTEIIAHDNTRLWLGTTVEQRWSGTTFAPLPAAALPRTSLDDSAERRIGERTFELGYLLHAHTDGDLYVRLPEANVVFAGGFLTNDRWPEIDWWTGGWSGGMLNAFDSLLPLCDEATVIVPSSGPLLTRAEFAAQREMYLGILDKVHKAFVRSLDPAETAAEKPAAGLRPEWGEADLFVTLAAQSLRGHLRSGVGNWLPRIP